MPAVPWRPGSRPRPDEPVLAADPRTAVLHGADLFDHGAWWEAHVVWEAVWREQPVGSTTREALQALVQAAAYHLKDAPALHAAGTRLRERALARLDGCITRGATELHGLDLVRLRDDLRTHRPGDPAVRLQGPLPRDTDRPEVP